MDVAELLLVITLLLSVPLVPRKLDVVVKADRILARTSSVSIPFVLIFGSLLVLVILLSVNPRLGP
jgi:hypothetical protein